MAAALHEPLDPADVEGIAHDLLRVARQDGNDAPDPIDVVTGIRFELSCEPPSGLCGWLDIEGALLYYRPRRGDVRLERWRMAHELGHLAKALRGIERRLHDERLVDQIARCLMMPRTPFERAMRRWGSAYSPAVVRAYPCVPQLQILQRAVELGF